MYVLAIESGLKTSTRILRGKLKLQFDLDLKGAKVPVTLKSHLGEIQHHLVLVSSTDASWRILDSKIMKTTTGCYDLSLIRPVHARPVRATLVGVRDGRSSSTGPDLEATMQLEKQAYVVGEKITGMIVIENCLKDPILDVTLKITRREFAERGEDFHGIEDVIKTRKLDVPDESTASRVEIDFGMTVPPVYPTWRTPDDTMVISYWIQVSKSCYLSASRSIHATKINMVYPIFVQFTVHTSKMVKVRGEQLIQIGTHYSHNVSQQ